MKCVDVVVIGAGAAGLMCASEAGRRGRRVLLLDHSRKLAEKIRISGGGRCNFTNLFTDPSAFLSNNAHFVNQHSADIRNMTLSIWLSRQRFFITK